MKVEKMDNFNKKYLEIRDKTFFTVFKKINQMESSNKLFSIYILTVHIYTNFSTSLLHSIPVVSLTLVM